MKPHQVKIGSNKPMKYRDRLAFLKNSELGKLFGFKQEVKR